MAAELIDWDLAVGTARRITPPGPQIDRAEADAVVADLRRLAVEAERHVEDYTRLHPAGLPAPVVVVDRPDWVRSNVEGLRAVTGPLLDTLMQKEPGRASLAVGRRITGVQVGAAL